MGPLNVPRQAMTSDSRLVSSDSSHGSFFSSRSSGSNSSSTSTARTRGSSVPEQPPEEWALTQLAYHLGAVVQGVDVKTNNEELREAKLLMSLSCSTEAASALSPQQPSDLARRHHDDAAHHDYNSNHGQGQLPGRVSPHSVSSSRSGGSGTGNGRAPRRDSFRFTCPSLSLDATHHCDTVRDASGGETSSLEVHGPPATASSVAPALMLGRTLKVDDVDALRLSSDAMARNVLMSFQKSMQWRMQSWVESLSQVLLEKEQGLHEQLYNAPQEDHQERLREETQKLLSSDEALLVAAVKESQDKIEVQQASTSFKVLQRVTCPPAGSGAVSVDSSSNGHRSCDGTMGEEWTTLGCLQEGEYLYDVTHLLEMQSTLSIATPAGCVKIDISVPGNIKGLFLSAAEYDDGEELTNVKVGLNTSMLAGMIEKGSRIAVRASVEALLKGDHVVNASPSTDADAAAMIVQNLKSPAKGKVTTTAAGATTSTPKRERSKYDRPVSDLVVVTPRDASSPSTFADSSSDSEDSANGGTGKSKPVSLQIPDSFKRSGSVLFPQATRYPPMKKFRTTAEANGTPEPAVATGDRVTGPSMITPLKTNGMDRMAFHQQRGPNFPLLVDAAFDAAAKKDNQ